MWILTTSGFVSAVEWQEKGSPKDGWIYLRARQREHLTSLTSRLESPRPKVQELSGADYRYRTWLTRDQFKDLLMLLADDVDYPNFKSAVLKKQGATKYEGALHRVWSVLASMQPTSPYARFGKTKLKRGKGKCEDCGVSGPASQFENYLGRTLCKNVGDCVRRMSPKLPV